MHFNSSINPAQTSFIHLQSYFQTESEELLDELVSPFSVQTPNMEELIVDELKKQYEEVASDTVHEDLDWDSFNVQGSKENDDYVFQTEYCVHNSLILEILFILSLFWSSISGNGVDQVPQVEIGSPI